MNAVLLLGVVVLAAAAQAVKVHVRNVVEYPGPLVEERRASKIRQRSVEAAPDSTDSTAVKTPKVKVIQHTAGSETFGDKVDGYNTEDDIVEPYERTPEEEAVSALAEESEVGHDKEQLDAKEQEEKHDEQVKKKFKEEVKEGHREEEFKEKLEGELKAEKKREEEFKNKLEGELMEEKNRQEEVKNKLVGELKEEKKREEEVKNKLDEESKEEKREEEELEKKREEEDMKKVEEEMEKEKE